MRRILASALGSVLSAAALSAAPCAPSQTTLCLNASRFEVEVSWRDSRGRTGVGQAVPITADTGYFWFFSEANIELVVKVLDARSINQKYWVFFGALSNVEYDLTVTDTTTGAVKTYHNDLGNFASVGDTGAFEPGPGVRAARETVEVQGAGSSSASLADIQGFIDREIAESAAAFTPCAAAARDGGSLFLSTCRFRLAVHWTDARGRHGAGHPVQLTDDTGYFWFFSASNVELMVKVLDARAVNGNFWVFFGALSNVEYTINVVDTVSGELHSYYNPPSTFASVGDTSAFRGGYRVSVQPDAAHSAAGTITAAAGGSLSATAADGTAFRLEVPPDAIYQDQEITMTPVRATGSFPFAGGLAAGVDLQPAGLLLPAGARLTIHTPAPISRSEETPVGWNGTGQDFFLVPPDPVAGDLTLVVTRFRGYGIARGTDAEREAQLQREPVESIALLDHQTSPLLRIGRSSAAVTGPILKAASDWQGDLRAAYENLYSAYRELMLRTDGEPAEVIRLITRVREWQSRVERYLGPFDTVYPGRGAEILGLFERMVRLALAKIHERCSADPQEIGLLPPIANLSRQLGLPVQLLIDETMGCLTFKLVFESQIIGSANMPPPYQDVDITDKVKATVTLRTRGYPALTSGEGLIDHTELTMSNIPKESKCSYTRSTGPDAFSAAIVWTNLYSEQGGPVGIDALYYNPGLPPSDITFTCPGDNPPVHFRNLPFGAFYILHDFTGSGGFPFKQGDWNVHGGADPWASAGVIKSDDSLLAITHFTLTHTPE